MLTEPASRSGRGGPTASTRRRAALALGDAAGAAALLARALEEPPTDGDRRRGSARARPGAGACRGAGRRRAAVRDRRTGRGPPGDRRRGDRAQRHAVLRRPGRRRRRDPGQARHRLPVGGAAREQLDVALLGVAYTSVAARREAEVRIAGAARSRRPGHRRLSSPRCWPTLAMDEVMYVALGRARRSIYARRALSRPLPLEPHRGENWAIVALGALLAATDQLEPRCVPPTRSSSEARELGLRADGRDHLRPARVRLRTQRRPARRPADAQVRSSCSPTCSAPSSSSLGVSAAVLAGLDRDETARIAAPADRPRRASATRPISCPARSSATPRACCAPPPATTKPPSRSFALRARPPGVRRRKPGRCRLAFVGRAVAGRARAPREARALAAEEVTAGRSFGAPRAIGIALRAQALVGPPSERAASLGRGAECARPLARSPRARPRAGRSRGDARAAGSAPRRVSRCSRGWRWQLGAALARSSAGPAPSSQRSESDPGPPTAPAWIRSPRASGAW